MIKNIIAIARKEFIHLIRDPRSLAISMLMPIILLFIYGYAASFDIKNIHMAVLDRSKTVQSRQLIDKFINSGYFTKVADLSGEKQFREMLDSGKASIVISIPTDFSKYLISRQKAPIQVLLDGSDPTSTAAALSYVSVIAQQFFSGLAVSSRATPAAGGGGPVNLVMRIWYNENLRSLNFYIPGLISSILMLLGAALTSLTIISEKEQGTMEALIASPVRKNELMIGKILPYIIIALWDVILVTAVGKYWFDVPIKGSYVLLLFCSCIFLTGSLSIGLLFSTIARSSQEAMQLALLTTMLPSMLLSGMIFPIENMPKVIQLVTYLVPARYFLRIMRSIYLKGVDINYLLGDLVPLTIFTLFMMWFTIRSFRKRMD